MIVTCVHVYVKPDHLEEFLRATEENHQSSVKEPGNVRFDTAQRSDDPTQFLLYEAYRTPEDSAAHKETSHYLKWRETVAPWMAKPREGIPYAIRFPGSL